MRIVSGRFKNKLVNTLETKELRPTLSKIRESIFDVLQDKVINSSWLDLFAGSGLVGIEAASRFAKEIVFVEKNPKHFKLLKQNLSNFNFEYKIYLNDSLRALKYFNEEQFDIIFLDPP
jgi:16S rRNA (guanine966-N2)-methyltransferase